MKSFLFKIFLSSLFSLFVLATLMIFFIITSFTVSYLKWREDRLIGVRENLEKILIARLKDNFIFEDKSKKELESIIYIILPQNSIFSFYDLEKKEVFKIIKVGRGRVSTIREVKINKLYPVFIDGKKVAYYSFYFFTQMQDLATDRFIKSTIISFFISLFIALIIAMLTSFVFSRIIINEVKSLAILIEKIEEDNFIKENIKEKKWSIELLSIVNSVIFLKERLKNEKKIREQWSADIAHDLRTPIAALKAQLEGMYDGVLKIDKERIKRNLAQLNKIELLVNDLTLLIKLESPEVKLEKSKVKIKDFIESILTNFEHIQKGKNIEVEVDIKDITIEVDRILFERAISNIIGNAFKFVNKNGKISIFGTTESGNKTVIKVFNTGSFIKDEDIEKIFERLYKLEDARNNEGSGLGLTIAKKIIELHNGSISVESVKNYGTTFKVNL